MLFKFWEVWSNSFIGTEAHCCYIHVHWYITKHWMNRNFSRWVDKLKVNFTSNRTFSSESVWWMFNICTGSDRETRKNGNEETKPQQQRDLVEEEQQQLEPLPPMHRDWSPLWTPHPESVKQGIECWRCLHQYHQMAFREDWNHNMKGWHPNTLFM